MLRLVAHGASQNVMPRFSAVRRTQIVKTDP